jgi:hypothetical protein
MIRFTVVSTDYRPAMPGAKAFTFSKKYGGFEAFSPPFNMAD